MTEFFIKCRLVLTVIFLVFINNFAMRGISQENISNVSDVRSIHMGSMIPDESYCDQPYIVVMKDGTWVCMLTTAPGGESSVGQHVVVTTSNDQGKTWTPLVDIESGKGPHASWVVPFLTPYQRLYAFYVYNGDETSFGKGKNLDSEHGWYVYRYSDDSGKTWSDRYRVPIRETVCDRTILNGKIAQMFWGVSKPQIADKDVFISFSKLGEHWQGMGEGWIVHSDNILNEKDPAKIHWELLPEGEYGIRHPDFGSVQEEHILQPLNKTDGFACVYRTSQGIPAISYSFDRCKNWSLPERMKYATGQGIHTPRACPMFWKCSNGNYLLWFHNNSSESYQNRNPAWICGGVEREGQIFWSQPEIVIYANSPTARMSYPDLVEIDNQYWIIETDKEVGRIHKIDTSLFEGLWQTVVNQLDANRTKVTEKGLVLQTSERYIKFPKEAANLQWTQGISLDFVVDGNALKEGDILFDNRDEKSTGITLVVEKAGAVRFTMSDKNDSNGKDKTTWLSDPGVVGKGLLPFTVIVDANPKIISFVANGQFCDGKGSRTFGWGRFGTIPTNLSGSETIQLSPSVKTLRIYNRYLRTNEAVNNHLAQ
ncbi:MAG: exo-alpha-sialidase [Planctomycetaceae bacterium]|jgi:hypothetical protein|nr:exo-alpha-sialidase [Planctomycetaceae bacterium]